MPFSSTLSSAASSYMDPYTLESLRRPLEAALTIRSNAIEPFLLFTLVIVLVFREMIS